MENVFMSTLIKKEGTAKQLQDCIDSLTVENYVDVIAGLINYNNADNLTTLEREFVNKFNSNARAIAEAFISAFLVDKSNKFIMEFILELEIEGTYTFNQHMDNDELAEYIEYYNLPSETKLTILKKYMTSTLDEVVKERTQSREEKEKEKLDKKIAEIERRIKSYKSSLEAGEEELLKAIEKRGY